DMPVETPSTTDNIQQQQASRVGKSEQLKYFKSQSKTVNETQDTGLIGQQSNLIFQEKGLGKDNRLKPKTHLSPLMGPRVVVRSVSSIVDVRGNWAGQGSLAHREFNDEDSDKQEEEEDNPPRS
ncbi:hypothetical protein HDU76_009448, partial [Blyttiomyces sp. JEL0837]